MPTRAAIYARQSRTGEGSESLELQVERCRESAERLGLEVVAELIEPPSTSGYKNRGRDRARFNELIDLTRSSTVDCVVVYKTDRLSRGGGPGYAPLVNAIEEAGGDPSRFILADGAWVTEFELSIRAAMDRESSALTAARMLDVRAREALAGKPRPAITRGYGYARDCTTVVLEEAERIKEATQRVLDGESVYSIVQDFNSRGVRTVGGGPWSTSVLRNLLRSGRIAGLREHHGEVVAEGQWEPIISLAEHERVLALTKPRRTAHKGAARTYPLIGFLVCGRCGQKLRSLGREGGGRSYACRKAENLHGCGGIRIKAEWVEDAVRDYVVAVLTDPDFLKSLLESLPVNDDDRQRRVVDELKELDFKRQRIADLAIDGAISAADAKRGRIELDELETGLRQQLRGERPSTALAGLPSTIDLMLEAWEERGINYQRSLVALTIEQIVIKPATTLGRSFDPDRLEWTLSV